MIEVNLVLPFIVDGATFHAVKYDVELQVLPRKGEMFLIMTEHPSEDEWALSIKIEDVMHTSRGVIVVNLEESDADKEVFDFLDSAGFDIQPDLDFDGFLSTLD